VSGGTPNWRTVLRPHQPLICGGTLGQGPYGVGRRHREAVVSTAHAPLSACSTSERTLACCAALASTRSSPAAKGRKFSSQATPPRAQVTASRTCCSPRRRIVSRAVGWRTAALATCAPASGRWVRQSRIPCWPRSRSNEPTCCLTRTYIVDPDKTDIKNQLYAWAPPSISHKLALVDLTATRVSRSSSPRQSRKRHLTARKSSSAAPTEAAAKKKGAFWPNREKRKAKVIGPKTLTAFASCAMLAACTAAAEGQRRRH